MNLRFCILLLVAPGTVAAQMPGVTQSAETVELGHTSLSLGGLYRVSMGGVGAIRVDDPTGLLGPRDAQRISTGHWRR